MTLLPRTSLFVALGLGLALGASGCGSDSSGEFIGYGGGGPASAAPVHSGGGSSGGGGGGGAGSSGGGSSGGGSHGDAGADGALGAFGNNANATSFTLVNASITTVPAGSAVDGYDPMKYGSTIDLNVVGRKLTVRADPAPALSEVGSMAFALDATYTYTANTSPYSLCGDDGKGKFNPCDLSVGTHTLTVTPYPLENLGGTPYMPTTFEFTVTDSAADAGTDAAGE